MCWVVQRKPGAHDAAAPRVFRALRGRDARLGGAWRCKVSFPLTDGGSLSAARIFRAALTSRSWAAPHPGHIHDLTRNPLTPVGPLKDPQDEQVRLVFLSLTIR